MADEASKPGQTKTTGTGSSKDKDATGEAAPTGADGVAAQGGREIIPQSQGEPPARKER